MWVPHDVRDQVVDFVRRWSEKTEIGAGRFVHWLGVRASKFYDWRERYGRVNEHNSWVPRDFWLEPWEKQAIIGFHLKNPLEGYRRLTFMMLDADVVAVSPSSVWRVLQRAGLFSRWKRQPSRKGTGFEQPPHAHQHWHIDVSYINVSGTFYYLCSVLDGYSRSIVHWDLRKSMTEAERVLVLALALAQLQRQNPLAWLCLARALSACLSFAVDVRSFLKRWTQGAGEFHQRLFFFAPRHTPTNSALRSNRQTTLVVPPILENPALQLIGNQIICLGIWMVVESVYLKSLPAVVFEAIDKFDHRHNLRGHDVLNFGGQLLTESLSKRSRRTSSIVLRYRSALLLREDAFLIRKEAVRFFP